MYSVLKRILAALFGLACLLLSAHAETEPALARQWVKNAKRIVFLGDSITYAGNYVVDTTAWLRASGLNTKAEVLNLGLPSETISGLSEPNHAGGQFPRPDLHTRLERVLSLTKPDVIFACYGMNCGLQQVFDEKRFAAFQNGALKLQEAAQKHQAKIIWVTPPIFDPLKAPDRAHYADVLDRYSQWLIDQRKQNWQVIDLHFHMKKSLETRRQTNPNFTFQKDAVHPDAAGHWVMAQALIAALGDDKSAAAASSSAMLSALKKDPKLLAPLTQELTILRDAWLTHTKHQRPGLAKGLPLPEAKKKAKEFRKLADSFL